MWRARTVQRRRAARGLLQGRLAQARDAEPLAGGGAFRAALVVARACVGVRLAGVERESAESPSSSATGRTSGVEVDRAARSARAPKSDAIWSSRPVWAPTQSFSIREHSSASSMRSGGWRGHRAQRQRQRDLQRRRGGQARAARDGAADSSRAPVSGTPARCSSATAPRTKARQPWSGAGRAARSCRAAEVARRSPHTPACQAARPHRHALAHREGQGEPVVVVGVLADQVDPTRREGGDLGAHVKPSVAVPRPRG